MSHTKMTDSSAVTVLIIGCAVVIMAAIASPELQAQTYQHQLADGTKILCNKCAPGHFLIDDCTGTNLSAICGLCLNGTEFQPTYTQARKCAKCNPCKGHLEEVYEPCTTTRETVCHCRAGSFRKKESTNDGFCLPHLMCPKGQGVVKAGDHIQDTICAECKEGYFSPNESSTQICQPCSQCPVGYEAEGVCTTQSDTLCRPIQEKSAGLSGGAVAGIVCGVLIAGLILVVCGILICARRGKGPLFVQRFYRQYIRRKASRPATNGSTSNGYTSKLLGEEDEQTKLLKIFPGLSKDLIHKEWKFFFRFLGADMEKYISEVEINYPNNVREQIHILLKDWVDREREKATVKQLISALKQQGRDDLVERYFQDAPTHV